MPEQGAAPPNAYARLVGELRESLPKLAADVAAAVLVWLFSMYVFIPLAREYAVLGIPLPQVISLVAIVALAAIVLEIARRVLRVIDAVADYVASELSSRGGAGEEAARGCRLGLRRVFYVLAASLLFLLFKDFLSVLHPALSAAVLLALSIWAVATLVSAGRAFSRLLEAYASEWVAHLERRRRE